MIVYTFSRVKLRVNCFVNLMEKDFLITHGNLVSLSVPVCWQSSRQNVYFYRTNHLVNVFYKSSGTKKTFQLYNGEWCWNSKFIFEKATILKILGWYRVRVVLLTCGGLRGRCKWEICKYILMYKEDKPADKRL